MPEAPTRQLDVYCAIIGQVCKACGSTGWRPGAGGIMIALSACHGANVSTKKAVDLLCIKSRRQDTQGSSLPYQIGLCPR